MLIDDKVGSLHSGQYNSYCKLGLFTSKQKTQCKKWQDNGPQSVNGRIVIIRILLSLAGSLVWKTYVRITFSSGSNLRDIANSITEVPEDWVQLPECCTLQPVGPLHVRQSPPQYGSPVAKRQSPRQCGSPVAKGQLRRQYGSPVAKRQSQRQCGSPVAKGESPRQYGSPVARESQRRYGSPIAT